MIETSGHLPECALRDVRRAPECVCIELRACEARVREVYESSDDYMLGIAVGMHNGWLEGHAAALDAARDAVAGIGYEDGPWLSVGPYRDDALAAIDALKGDT